MGTRWSARLCPGLGRMARALQTLGTLGTGVGLGRRDSLFCGELWADAVPGPRGPGSCARPQTWNCRLAPTRSGRELPRDAPRAGVGGGAVGIFAELRAELAGRVGLTNTVRTRAGIIAQPESPGVARLWPEISDRARWSVGVPLFSSQTWAKLVSSGARPPAGPRVPGTSFCL